MQTTINYNGIEITLIGKYVGKATPWDKTLIKHEHIISVGIDDKHIEFSFYGNNCELDEDELREAFYCFLSDGISYDDSRDIDDFQDSFGYTRVSECLKAYNGCKEAYEKWRELTDIDIYDIAYWLQEEYMV